jgi:LacI family transcriptional regulator
MGRAVDAKPAKISDVAALAGVGVGTVSRVLNGSARVSESTRRMVNAAIEELEYRPSPAARALSTGRSSTVAVVAPFFTSPSMVERLRGVVETLDGTQYDLMLYDVQSPRRYPEHLLELARTQRGSGVLSFSLTPTDADVERFRRAQVPLVLIDARHAEVPHLVIDDEAGGYMATRHLLALGHRRIALVADTPKSPYGFHSSNDRRAGYRRALVEAGCPLRPEFERAGKHGRQIAHRLTDELLGVPEPPTAIFAVSDTQALGVLEAAQEAGYRVPEDLSVVGFDDIEVAAYVGLTTVRQPLRASGVRGAELLLDAMDGVADPVAEVMPLEVVTRRTTGPVR